MLRQPSISTEHPPTEVEHNNYCDLCGAFPMIGARYKCLHCVDFDVCSNCVNAAHYTGHFYVRLPIAHHCSRDELHPCIRPQRCSQQRPPPPPPPPPPCSARPLTTVSFATSATSHRFLGLASKLFMKMTGTAVGAAFLPACTATWQSS